MLNVYLAYGSNMEPSVMRRHCPRAIFMCQARLPAHRFSINRDGYASVRQDDSAVVHGVLWNVQACEARALDAYEECHAGLYRTCGASAVTPAGTRMDVFLYQACDARTGIPEHCYLGGLLFAAELHGFPPGYTAEIRTWLPRQRSGGRYVT